MFLNFCRGIPKDFFIWLRHELETFKKRLKALETKAVKDNMILTGEQVRALKKAKDKKRA
jgi:hypothetical protein